MPTPSENLANNLELLATILRHPSNDGSERFRAVFVQFNDIRLNYPELLTNEELNHQMKFAHEEMDHMRGRPFKDTNGYDEIVSERLERLNTEHQKRFG